MTGRHARRIAVTAAIGFSAVVGPIHAQPVRGGGEVNRQSAGTDHDNLVFTGWRMYFMTPPDNIDERPVTIVLTDTREFLVHDSRERLAGVEDRRSSRSNRSQSREFLVGRSSERAVLVTRLKTPLRSCQAPVPPLAAPQPAGGHCQT